MKFYGLHIIFIVLFSTIVYGQTNDVDSLEIKLDSIQGYKLKIRFLDSLHFIYYNNNWDSCLIVLDKALAISTQAQDTFVIADFSARKGVALYEIGKYKDALNADLQAYNLYSAIDYKKGVAAALNEIGTIYDILGESEKAIDYLNKSLELRLSIGNQKDIYDSYNNIGVYYYYQGDYDKALLFYKKAQATREDGSVLNNIGEIYYELGNYKEALKYFNKALNDYLKTESSYLKALVTRNIGLVYFKKKNYTKAVDYINQSLALAKKVHSSLLVKEIYQYLTSIYKEKGDYQNALKYHQLYTAVKDSLFKENQIKAIADMNAKFEVSFKEKENQLLKKDILIQKQKFKNQRIISIASIIILLLFGVVAITFYRGKKKLQAANDLLKEKNFEIQQQNEEIRSQSEALHQAYEQISKQNKELQLRNKRITESIQYAKQIQDAVLDYNRFLHDRNLLILNLPRDVVSGDFFFQRDIGKNISVYAVADCTGHGVPGAFMSMLGASFLYEITNNTVEPAQILDTLRAKVKYTLSQEHSLHQKTDGMDIALFVHYKDKDLIKYSGAYNPLYLIRKNADGVPELTKYKATKQPIGFYSTEKPFETKEIIVRRDDLIYLFSDGYIDQFGGEHNRKFMTKTFSQLLLSIAEKPLPEQKELLYRNFVEWKGANKQTDDILIIGYSIT